MSKAGIQHVKGLTQAPDGTALSSAERRVLKVIGELHRSEIWCAFPSMAQIGALAEMSVPHARRQVASLERKGVLRRISAVHDRHGSQTSNEYELVGLQAVPVAQAARDAVFRFARSRQAIQVPLNRGGRKKKAVAGSVSPPATAQMAVGAVYSPQRCDETSGAHEHAVPGQPSVLVLTPGVHEAEIAAAGSVFPPAIAVEKRPPMIAPPNHHDCPPQSPRLPLELLSELYEDKYPPVPPLKLSQREENYPVMAKARATASAEATATTPEGENAETEARPAEVSSSVPGRAGFRLVRGGRLPRDPAGRALRRAGLDGTDAALHDETTEVLRQGGISPERCKPRLRQAIEDALRLRCELTGCSASAAGKLAVERLRSYREHGRFLRITWAPLDFFRDGHWLQPGTWPVDRRAVHEARESNIGGHHGPFATQTVRSG